MHMSRPEMFISVRNRKFHRRPGAHMNNRPTDAHLWDLKDDACSTTAASAPRIRGRRSVKLHCPASLTTDCTTTRAMVLILDQSKTSSRSPKQTDWTSSKDLGVPDSWMTFSLQSSITRNAMPPLMTAWKHPNLQLRPSSLLTLKIVDGIGFRRDCCNCIVQKEEFKGRHVCRNLA